MRGTGFRRAMSPTAITAVLTKMTKQKTATKQYVRAQLLAWPPVCALADERNFAVQSDQLKIGADGKVLLHSSLAFFERGSPHEYAIAQCMNQYTPVGFFIAGRPVSDQIPHLAYVRPSVQTQRRPEIYEDGRLVAIDMSYNDYSTHFPLPPQSAEEVQQQLEMGVLVFKQSMPEIQQLDAATRSREQGNRAVIIPDSHSNMAAALDDGGSDDDDEEECDVDDEDPGEYAKW